MKIKGNLEIKYLKNLKLILFVVTPTRAKNERGTGPDTP